MGNRPEDVKHQFASRRGRIDALLQTDQVVAWRSTDRRGSTNGGRTCANGYMKSEEGFSAAISMA